MHWKIMSMLVCLNLLTLALHGQRQTVDYPYPWGIDRVSFNPSKVFRSQLNEWMQLSPTLGDYNEFLIPENIDLCKLDDSRYKGCGSKNSYFNIDNAHHNLLSIESRIHKLESQNYPTDLQPIVTYVISIQRFWLEAGIQQVEFLTTADMAALEKKIGLVDPASDCKHVLEQIKNTQEKDQQSKLVRFDWQNCLWFSERDKLGPYPQRSWKAFLATHDITETIIEESPD